jgi:hypothetical protein
MGTVATREQPALEPADDAPGHGRLSPAHREVLCPFLDGTWRSVKS